MSNKTLFRTIGAKRRFARLATVASAGVLLAATLGADAPKQPTGAVLRPTTQQLTLAPGDPHLSKLFSWADSATGTKKILYAAPATDFPTPSVTTIDVGSAGVSGPANAPCSPVITKITGQFSTRDGYITVNGTCFGTSGNIVLTGFPNGNPQVKLVSQNPQTLAGNLPTITGVPDLTMHVQVANGPLLSKPV